MLLANDPKLLLCLGIVMPLSFELFRYLLGRGIGWDMRVVFEAFSWSVENCCSLRALN